MTNCNFCITKGDDYPRLIRIELEENQGDWEIDKLVTTCGKITHVYNNPDFPFFEGYNRNETLEFDLVNNFFSGVVLGNGEFKTLNGRLSFRACPQVVDYKTN